MASTAQLEANRANAQLSTGPSTPEGIANAKHNATRHGLTGKQVVIKGEDPAQYDALRQQLVHDYSPSSEREAMLVEDISQNYWRLQRARRIEAQVIDKFGETAIIFDPEAIRAFRNVTRYVNSIERSWRSSTRLLDALQKARRKAAEEAAKDAAIRAMAVARPTNIATPKQNGFVSHSNSDAPLSTRL